MREPVPGRPDPRPLVAAIEQRLTALQRDRNPVPLLDPAAEAEAKALGAYALSTRDGEPPCVIDRPVLGLVALVHYGRWLALGRSAGLSDRALALALFALIGQFDPQAVPDELREEVDALGTPPAEDLATMSARANELYARWGAVRDAQALEEAVKLLQRCHDVLPEGHHDGPMVLSNLCAALRDRYVTRQIEADLEAAVSAGRRAVESAEDGDPNRWMYFGNLSGALNVRNALLDARRQPADLDEAVVSATEAVRVAPRPQALFHGHLGMALLARFRRDTSDADLRAAVGSLRLAVRHGGTQRDVPPGAELAFPVLLHGTFDDRHDYLHSRKTLIFKINAQIIDVPPILSQPPRRTARRRRRPRPTAPAHDRRRNRTRYRCRTRPAPRAATARHLLRRAPIGARFRRTATRR